MPSTCTGPDMVEPSGKVSTAVRVPASLSAGLTTFSVKYAMLAYMHS